MTENKKNKILVFTVLTLILISVVTVYYKTIVLRDFEIVNDLEGEIE